MAKRKRGDKRRHGFFSFRSRKEAAAPRRQRSTRALGVQQLESRAMMDANDPDIYLQGNQLIGPAVFDGPAYMHTEEPGQIPFLLETYGISGDPRIISTTVRFTGEAVRGVDYEVFVKHGYGPQIPLIGDTIDVRITDGGTWIYIDPREDSSFEIKEKVKLTLESGDGYNIPFEDGWHTATDPDFYLTEAWGYITDIAPAFWGIVICDCGCGCGDPNEQIGQEDENTGSVMLKTTLQDGKRLRLSTVTDPRVVVRAFDTAPAVPTGKTLAAVNATLTLVDFSGQPITSVPTVTNYYSATGVEADKQYDFAFQADVASIASGIYNYKVDIQYVWSDSTQTAHQVTGKKLAINNESSFLGSGWTFDELDYVQNQWNGATLVRGDNQAFWYAGTFGSLYESNQSEPNASTLELIQVNNEYAYRLTGKDGSLQEFRVSPIDSNRYLIHSRKDQYGNETTYQYDAQGRITLITDPDGSLTAFNHLPADANGFRYVQIDQRAAATGDLRRTEFKIQDSNNRVQSITFPDPGDGSGVPSTAYTYLANGLVDETQRTVISPSGTSTSTTKYSYNFAQQVIKTEKGIGTSGYSYEEFTPVESRGLVDAATNSPTNRATLSLAATPGGSTREVFGGISRERSFTVDSFGLVTSETTEDGTTYYVRDQSGALVRTVEPDPDGAGPLTAPITDYVYSTDGKHDLESVLLPDRVSTRSWEYNTAHQVTSQTDEFGRLTVHSYDGQRLESTRTVVNGTLTTVGSLDVVTSYTYTDDLPVEQIKTMTDPLGRVTTYDYYNDALRPNVTGLLMKVTHPDSTFTLSDYYDDTRLLKSQTDELGRTTSFTYDDAGRLKTVTLPNPDPQSTDPGPTTTYAYDTLGKIVQITEPSPDPPGTENPRPGRYTKYQYLDGGKHVQITESPREYEEEAPEIISHQYLDDQRRVIREVDALGRETLYTYNQRGQIKTLTLPNPGGAVTLPTPVYTYAYDNLGRLTSLTNPAPGVYSQPTVNASFDDDPFVVSDMVPMTLVELSGQTPAFDDAQDDPGSLRYEIVGNTNAALFHTLYISPEQGHFLIAAYAQGVIGDAVVTIRATNSRGLSQTRTLTFSRSAANASERLVNTTTTGAQSAPVTQALAGGNYVVVWQGEGTGDADGVFFQLYRADDTAIGGETRVNVTTAGAQSQPAVAADDEGGFAIVWTEQPTSGNTRVMFRQYADDGSALTGELTVNTNGDATDAQPDVAYVTTDSGAYFIVVWQGSVSGAQRDGGGSYSDADGVFSRAYQQGTGGWSWSDIQIVNTTTAGAQRRPTVASTRSGFAVAWEVTGTGPSAGIFLQRFVTPTMQASGETRVGFEYAGGVGSSYAVMSDGGLVIAWEVSALGATGVAAQMFAADGTPVGQQFLVSGLAAKPAVTLTADGFAVGYLWSGADPGVYVARYNPDGSLASAAARISDLAQPTPTSVDLSGSEDGRLIMTWARAAGSDTNNAYVKMLAPLPVSFAGGPQRVQALYPDRAILASADQIMLVLSQPAASLDINQVQVARVTESGEEAVALQSATRISELQYIVTFQAAATVAGTYRVRVLADAVAGGLDQDQDGTAGETNDDRFSGAFTIVPGPSAQAGVTSYQYDALGRVTQETDPAGAVTTYAYGFEANGNRTTTETILDPDGAGPLGNLVTKSEYDDLDRLVKETLPGAGLPYREYFYDKAGNLVRQRDALGNYTDYRYDSRDRQIRRFDANAISGVASTDALDNLTLTSGQGPITISTYTATGQLATVTDPRGGLTTYEYDRLDRLKKLIQPSAILIGVSDAATEYAYDYAGNLVKVTQPNPRAPGDAGYNALDIPVTEYEYDRQNNRVKMIQPAPFPGGTRPEFDYTYDDAGQLKSQTDPLDRRTDYDYDGLGRLKQVLQPTIDLFEPGQRAETTFTYDTLGNLLRETDPLGNVTQHLYDSASRRVATIDAMGSVAAMSYDALGQTIATTDELGRVTRYEHDVWGNQTLVHQNDPLDLLPSATSPKTIYAYDAEGNLLSVTDPRQHVTDYAYDKLNRLTSVTQPAPQVGQARPVTEYDYNDAGDLLSQTDPEGRVTRHTYDYLGQKTSMMAPDMTVLGGVNGAVTNYQYDRLGRLVKEIAPDPLTLGGTNRPETKYGYDLLGRMASQTDPDPDGAGSQSSQTTQFSFDAAGQLQFVLGPAGSQYFAYDTMGRRYVESSGGEELTIRLYDLAGNLFIELDRLGQVRSWTFDGLNRMTEAIDSRDGLTGYEYDAAGNRTLLVDPVGNETGFQYDQLNRLARETDPLGHARSFQYDANGNLTTAVDRLGRKVELGYDALNRKTSETWKDAAGVQVGTPITWSYDKSGRMLSATSAAASYGYTYDPAGQLDTLTSNLAGLGQSVVVDQAHNYLGRRKQLKTTIGAAADLVNDYAYDNLSRLTQVTQAAQAGGATVAEKRVDFAYEADNQIDTISRYKALAGGAGNLVATSDHAYDALRRLTDINNSPAQSSDWHWDYDAENQVTEFETTTSSGTANIAYAYDANGQLIGAAGAQTRSYVWDLNGNRRNYQDVGGANNQLTETATDTYTYDAEGNRKSATDKSTQQHTIYEWDHRNRLTKATIKANSSPSALTLKVIDIAYDAGDRRVSKTVTPYNAQGVALTPATEYYVWDQDTRSGSDNVIFDFHDADGAGSNPAMLKTRYLLGDVVDQVLAQETVTGSEVLWLLQDNLGSVRETVKNDGTVNSRVDFDPFGNMISIIDPSNGGAATTLKTRLNFTGQEYDADLKLVWYSDGTGRGRWYDPATGTFINQDALGFAAGDANLYRYVGNGATYLVDPSGQDVAFWGGFFADLPRALCDTFSSGEAFDGYAGFINGSVDTVAWLLSGGRYDPELRKAAPFGHTGASEDGGRIADVTLASQYGIVVVYTGLCGAPVILLAPRADGMTTIVSRWGRPGLKNGDWVMNGPISRWNYTWSGKWDPFPWNQFAPYGSGRQFDVPRTTLNCPGGIIGGIKGGLGQRIYVGPDILLP